MLMTFRNALNSIPSEYFGHTERLFTYELYHKLRNICQEENLLHDNIVIDAELPKRMLSEQEAIRLGLLPLDSLISPDIIIHERDTGNHQQLVAEVKAEKYLSKAKALKDINKLISLRYNYRFQFGVFVAINVDMNRICQLIQAGNHEIMWPIHEGQRQIDPNLDINIFTKLDSDSVWEYCSLIEILQ